MPIYLYVKTHNKTGLKYLGKTTKKNPYKYPGSGVKWNRHLKKHGKDISTEILLVTEDKEELKQTGLFFSKLWNIVESDEWANFIPESGDGIDSDQARKIAYDKVDKGTHPFQRGNRSYGSDNNGRKYKDLSYDERFDEETANRIRESQIKSNKTRWDNPIFRENTSKKLSETRKRKCQSGEIITWNKGKKLHYKTKSVFSNKTTCPYCNKEGNIPNMKRWHFDNCKFYTKVPVWSG